MAKDLRFIFAAMFLAQAGIATAVAAVVLLLGAGTGRPSSLGPVLAVLAFLQCALGVGLPDVVGRNGERGSAIAATLLAGVLLATPAWFLMLAVTTGQSIVALFLIAAALAAGYALGYVVVSRLAARIVPDGGGETHET